ncbi:MAG: sensor domain-containing diguanylate cyclase [Rhodospirillales bacterium]
MRKITCAAYYVLTVTLFSRMFRDELQKVGYSAALSATQWSCVLLCVVTAALPYTSWLPWLWVLSSFSVVVVVFLLTRILLITRSTVAMWYAASLGLTLFASFYEVIAAALSLKGLIGSINFVTASLSSGLLAALAIAEQMRQERLERMKAQAELHNTYEAIPIGLFTLDANGIFLRGNPALKQMLGVDPVLNARDHWSDHFEAGAWARLRDGVQGEAHEMEIRELSADGEEAKLFLVKSTFANDKIEGSLQDITERAKATSRLRFLADHDPLTSTLNRRGIEKGFDAAMAELAGGRELALAYLDLDRFKLINDLFGHLSGDEVLKQVCNRIKETLQESHQLGRIGGDEFVILFRGTNIETATRICREIVDKIVTLPYRTADKAFQVKGSIGLVEVGAGCT